MNARERQLLESGRRRSVDSVAASIESTPRVFVEVAPVHKLRLAILPFENLSPDPANAFFADGLHEEIISTIAQRAPSIEVISRTTMMSYRQASPKSLNTVARELQASHVIEGSVRREGNTVRFTLQLIDAGPDRQIWSQTYDRTLSNALTLQSEVAADIGSQLSLRLSGTAYDNPSFVARTPEAYDAYLRGRVAWQSLNPGWATHRDWQGVLKALDEAVMRDPNFTPAHVIRMLAGISMFVQAQDRSNQRLRQIREDLEAAQRQSGRHAWVLLATAVYWLHIGQDRVRTLENVRAAQAFGVTVPHLTPPVGD